MFRKKVPEPEFPELYTQRFYVHYMGDYGIEKMVCGKDTQKEAEVEAKKYVHISKVWVTEQLTKEVARFPKTPICT